MLLFLVLLAAWQAFCQRCDGKVLFLPLNTSPCCAIVSYYRSVSNTSVQICFSIFPHFVPLSYFFLSLVCVVHVISPVLCVFLLLWCFSCGEWYICDWLCGGAYDSPSHSVALMWALLCIAHISTFYFPCFLFFAATVKFTELETVFFLQVK